MILGRLNTLARSPVSPISPAATGDHRPDPDFTVCPMIHVLVGAVKPGGSGVMFRRRILYRSGLNRSCNLVLHAICLHAVSDHGMPFAAMTGCNSSGLDMKVYEVRLGIIVCLHVRVLTSKAHVVS